MTVFDYFSECGFTMVQTSPVANLWPSSIFWSVAANGECWPRTFQNGRRYIGTSTDGGKMVVL